ncbi:MAG: RimK-like ATPgrasp N-terminal domain-containing protein [Methanomicrobiales archaeon]|nr:RimK-like ATPgrasp N-terminal domain-containing protein [Methanomicrobiales archaeon]
MIKPIKTDQKCNCCGTAGRYNLFFMVTTPIGFKKDTVYEKVEGATTFLVSDNYFYKSETYYRIVRHEIEGKYAIPSSKDLIEAFVVPICLEKARMQGIRVCSWEVSYSYAPLPSIAYGIHYYSDPAEYSILRDSEVAREVIHHITNHGRYPFCYQPITDSSEVFPVIAVFGDTTEDEPELRQLAMTVYTTFRVPFLSMTVLWDGENYSLSSLSNAKYSKLSPGDRTLLRAHLETMPGG